MILFPAIDIKDNQCVRLIQGRLDEVTIYSKNPLEIAQGFVSQGAEYLHLVDLNGASNESLINLPTLKNIISNLSIPIQVGGGIRSLDTVRALLKIGVTRVIVGTLAIENIQLLKELVTLYPDQIIVSIDAKKGKVATRGWQVVTNIEALDLCQILEGVGIKTIVYTDIAKDGMLEGPNFDDYTRLSKQTNLNIIASGGISSLDDLKKLSQMGLYGTIIGKALYEHKFTLKEALLCLQNA